jgi:hypothetical protein
MSTAHVQQDRFTPASGLKFSIRIEIDPRLHRQWSWCLRRWPLIANGSHQVTHTNSSSWAGAVERIRTNGTVRSPKSKLGSYPLVNDLNPCIIVRHVNGSGHARRFFPSPFVETHTAPNRVGRSDCCWSSIREAFRLPRCLYCTLPHGHRCHRCNDVLYRLG